MPLPPVFPGLPVERKTSDNTRRDTMVSSFKQFTPNSSSSCTRVSFGCSFTRLIKNERLHGVERGPGRCRSVRRIKRPDRLSLTHAYCPIYPVPGRRETTGNVITFSEQVAEFAAQDNVLPLALRNIYGAVFYVMRAHESPLLLKNCVSSASPFFKTVLPLPDDDLDPSSRDLSRACRVTGYSHD